MCSSSMVSPRLCWDTSKLRMQMKQEDPLEMTVEFPTSMLFSYLMIPPNTSNIRLLVTAMLRILSNFGLASLSVRLWIPIRWVKMSNNRDLSMSLSYAVYF